MEQMLMYLYGEFLTQERVDFYGSFVSFPGRFNRTSLPTCKPGARIGFKRRHVLSEPCDALEAAAVFSTSDTHSETRTPAPGKNELRRETLLAPQAALAQV